MLLWLFVQCFWLKRSTIHTQISCTCFYCQCHTPWVQLFPIFCSSECNSWIQYENHLLQAWKYFVLGGILEWLSRWRLRGFWGWLPLLSSANAWSEWYRSVGLGANDSLFTNSTTLLLYITIYVFKWVMSSEKSYQKCI